jgi:hypothetical protein
MSRMQRLTVLAVLAATLLAAAPATQAATPRAPKDFYGVMWDRAAIEDEALGRDAQWAQMQRSGVQTVRLVFSWARAQPEAGMEPDFADIDRKVELASVHGIDLLPVVLYAPLWASRFPGRHGSPPDHASDYAAFVSRLVGRYGPKGTFWTERPDIPKRPLRDWQIWNEPHFDFYWYAPGSSWAREYVQLLKAAKRAIRTADPGARVVLAGFADASWKVLEEAYKAGARGAFDVATINVFTGRPGFVMTAARLTRHVLQRHRDGSKPIWVTETTFPAGKGSVPRPEQEWQRRWYTTKGGMASRLTELYRLGLLNATRLGLRRIYWYTWASSYQGRDDLFDYSGLVRVGDDGSSKPQPSLRAYRRAARR